MNRYESSSKLGIMIASMVIATFILASDASAQNSKPNILLIITDQQHAGMMSCAGNKWLETPAMDSLARGGVRFENAYASNPVCVPSRISMATGMMAGRFGVFTNGAKAKIPQTCITHSLGNVMKSGGYDTFYGGKTHLPREIMPPGAGYTEVFGDSRDRLPDACIEFMTKKRDKPFFAVASFINPHDICFAHRAKQKTRGGMTKVNELYNRVQTIAEDRLPPLPDNFGIPATEPDSINKNLKVAAVTPAGIIRNSYTDRDWRYYRWIYCRLTEQVDANIGRILDALKKNGLEENTLVIFTSDHGDMDGSHRLASKDVLYDQSTNVPFIMQYKGVIPADSVCERGLVSTGLDILPTLCEYAGLPIPKHLPGRSLRLLAERGADSTRRAYVVSENPNGRMVRTERYKYCVYAEGKIRESLIDMQNDPGEMNNLASDSQFSSVLNQHRTYLQEWINQTEDIEAKAFAIQPE